MELVKRSRLPWRWSVALIAAVLLLFLILAAYFEGQFGDQFNWDYWRVGLQGPVIIIYVLAVYPFMWRLWQRAILAFRPLMSLEEDAFYQIAMRGSVPKRHWEWVALLAGGAFSLGMGRPWMWVDQWLDVYVTVTDTLMFSLLGWLIHGGLAANRHLAWLSRQQLDLDIFNTGLLVPIARWSLGISLAFVGGISLSLVFQLQESLLNWQNITIYSILVCATVLLFFFSIRSIHGLMARAKRQELTTVRKHLVDARLRLREKVTEDLMDGTEGIYSAVAAWGLYERQIQETSEWPFNANIIRRLAASILVPAIVYLIKIVSGLGVRL
jgi:hypothetical protein